MNFANKIKIIKIIKRK